MKTYRLASNRMVYTPNIVRWAINGYKFEDDRATLINAIMSWEGVTREAAIALLSGAAPYHVEDDTVVFTA